MSLIDSITSLRTQLDNAESEILSLSGGKKASAARARKSLQNIKSSCHTMRKSITDHTKGMVTKPRVKKEIICPSHAAVEAEEEAELEAKAEAEVIAEPVKVKRVRKVKAKVV